MSVGKTTRTPHHGVGLGPTPAAESGTPGKQTLLGRSPPRTTRDLPADAVIQRKEAGPPSVVDAGVAPDDVHDVGSYDAEHNMQVACVSVDGLGEGFRSGGLPTPEEIAATNAECRDLTGYHGPDVAPTSESDRQIRTGMIFDEAKIDQLRALLSV